MTPSPALKSLSTAEPSDSLSPPTGLLTLHLSQKRGLPPKGFHGNFGNRLAKKENDYVRIRCLHEN